MEGKKYYTTESAAQLSKYTRKDLCYSILYNKLRRIEILEEYTIFGLLESCNKKTFSGDFIKHLVCNFLREKRIPMNRVTKLHSYGKYLADYGNVHFTSPFIAPLFAIMEAPRPAKIGGCDFTCYRYEIHICLDDYPLFHAWLVQRVDDLFVHVTKHGQHQLNAYERHTPFYERNDGKTILRCFRNCQREGPVTIWKREKSTLAKQEVRKRYGRETLMQFEFELKFWQVSGRYGVQLRFDEDIVIKDNKNFKLKLK